MQDYMCTDCGVEYETNQNIPEKCPACSSNKRVPVTFPASDGVLYGSWSETEWDENE